MPSSASGVRRASRERDTDRGLHLAVDGDAVRAQRLGRPATSSTSCARGSGTPVSSAARAMPAADALSCASNSSEYCE